MSCEFCNYNMTIEPQRIVYEDERYMAFVSNKPIVHGHCVVIPKDHSEFVKDVDDVRKFFTLIWYISESIKNAVGSDQVKIELRYGNGKINHTHVHLIPINAVTDTGIDVAEKILENLRKSQWYDTLNRS